MSQTSICLTRFFITGHSTFYGSCGLMPFWCTLTHCHCGKNLLSHEGKLEMDQWSSDRGKEGTRVLLFFNTMSFSYGGLPLVGIDPCPFSMAHISRFVWWHFHLKIRMYVTCVLMYVLMYVTSIYLEAECNLLVQLFWASLMKSVGPRVCAIYKSRGIWSGDQESV